ncbi:hypothetical protein V1L54_14395 [Streptomyces sp. TRM 70361]|uniref:hypothetical protein n=1 Tax=Streptomyces sp. TRM 70361 TaxID=3116553 RepID=UPI002E7B971E|nr:hypothetical protein [Streptomyces sp. TRM 70361]MEE1940581.1 hypothetical protein [Streptomyces sp. TRM 70361]
MTADPITEPMNMPQNQDPNDLLIASEKAADAPIRAEYVEGTMIVPPQPDDHHNDAAAESCFQLRSAGFPLAGLGSGYRVAGPEGTRSLIVPDFCVRRRKPTEPDEAYRRAHRGRLR